MPQLKKIMVSVPDNLLKEVDDIVTVDKINRSELVRKAMKLYVRKRKQIDLEDKMKSGYEQMAEINMMFAELCLNADNEQQQKYERVLGELER